MKLTGGLALAGAIALIAAATWFRAPLGIDDNQLVTICLVGGVSGLAGLWLMLRQKG